MQTLDKKFIEEQKKYLLKEKKRLELELLRTDKFPTYGDTEDDNAEEVEDFIISQGQEKKFHLMLKDVNRALKKIEKGNYGYCENCKPKQLIDKKRLKAFPAAITCIKYEKNK